jgi:hypothetical protein
VPLPPYTVAAQARRRQRLAERVGHVAPNEPSGGVVDRQDAVDDETDTFLAAGCIKVHFLFTY